MTAVRRPSSIPHAAAGEWSRGVKLLRQRGEFLADRDCPLLERLIVNRLNARRALVAAQKHPFVEGSTGQLVAHPGFAIAARCDRVALAYARELNLTPDLFGAAAIDDDPDEQPRTAFDALDELEPRRKRKGS